MEAEADVGEAGAGFSWLVPTALGFIFLTFNSAAAIHHRSNGDAGAITFMVWQYMVNLVLVLLFLCLRLFERAPPGSLTREKLKVSVWVLTTFPTTVLTYMIAVSIPVPVQVLLAWGVAGATGLGGFYAFFLHNNEGKDDDVDAIAPNGRVKKVLGFVLAALRWRLPQPAAAGLAQDPHDIAWSGARLIVDSGATRHAVGNVLLLDGFQRYSPPLVATLADGSNLRILGVGRIQRGEFSIPNVCLVEGLKDALISTQQLDSDHGLISCFGNGICRIMQADGTEVGGAILEEGGYMLRFLNVP